MIVQKMEQELSKLREAGRKKAAKSGEAEPVAWIADKECNVNGFIDARVTQEGEFNTPLYTHPAPAPASPTEHTAADAIFREEGSGHKSAASAAGVPDVEGLIAELNALDLKRCQATWQDRPYSILGIAADALAALQSQVAFLDHKNKVAADLMRIDRQEIAQQAERIAALTADLERVKADLKVAHELIDAFENTTVNAEQYRQVKAERDLLLKEKHGRENG